MFKFLVDNYHLKKIKEFIDPRVIKWLLIGNFAAFGMGYLAFIVTIALQLILRELNIWSEQDELPTLLEAWQPSLTEMVVFFIIIILLQTFLQYLTTMSSGMSHVIIGARVKIGAFYDLLQRKDPPMLKIC